MSDTIKSVITCHLDGKIETISEGSEALPGYTAEELIGKVRVSLFSPGLVVPGPLGGRLKTASIEGEWEGDTVSLTKVNEKFAAHIKITPTMKDDVQVGFCGVTLPLEDVDIANVEPDISFTTRMLKWMVIARAPFLTTTIVPVLPGDYLAHKATGTLFSHYNDSGLQLAIAGTINLHLITGPLLTIGYRPGTTWRP